MSSEEKIKIESQPKFWTKLWHLLAPSQRDLKAIFFWALIIEGVAFLGPYFFKLIIDRLTNFDFQTLAPLLGLIVLFFLSEQTNSLLDWVKSRKCFKVLVGIEYYLPIRAHRKLMSLSLGYHEKENTGNKIIKIEKGLNKIVSLVADVIFEVMPTVIQLALTFVVLLFIDYRLALVFLIFVPIFVYLTYKLNKDIYPMRKKRYKDYEMASGKLGQAIININAVQSFVQEEREIKEYRKIKKKVWFNELFEWFKVLRFSWGRSLIVDLGRLSILFLGIFLVVQKNITLGTLVFAITLAEKSFFSLFRLTRFYDRLAEGMVGVNRFMDLLEQPLTIVNNKKGYRPKNFIGEIDFQNVSFSYPKTSEAVLKNINLKINSGCLTALVGPSGSGKTTLARLIYRHYDPTKGEILIDGRKLSDYDLYALREQMAIVPQEVEIFDISVKDNIAYANPQASFQEIQAAARIANAEEFILKLEKGYRTLVGERGIKLSGGQRQRLGIARAILANPKILIFDEATSNLDSYSEQLIQLAIDKISRDRTLIIIAHRLSTIKKADKIVVLENGQVVETGSHIELAQINGGLYSKLLKLQNLGEIK